MELNETTILAVGLAIVVIEYVLGETKWVKPNSIIAIILGIFKTIGEKLTGKK